MDKVKLDVRLTELFDELDMKAYDVNYHNYNYKYANQIIRKYFEKWLCDGKSAIIDTSKLNIACVTNRFNWNHFFIGYAIGMLLAWLIAMIAF